MMGAKKKTSGGKFPQIRVKNGVADRKKLSVREGGGDSNPRLDREKCAKHHRDFPSLSRLGQCDTQEYHMDLWTKGSWQQRQQHPGGGVGQACFDRTTLNTHRCLLKGGACVRLGKWCAFFGTFKFHIHYLCVKKWMVAVKRQTRSSKKQKEGRTKRLNRGCL